ncbi:hypothetical protein [Labrenzia sp. PHM005]|uniref:hypothetical protein n=1 Tax=Labrenzia sp. PHM005 TaxID=2590016 RepID=UPI00113FE93D|nr:hypothetical protein [Labrenzia sp. PHM005]QDG78466.1 hypothetical protein FJ695_22840 [Labrenzia sp. PHM005]
MAKAMPAFAQDRQRRIEADAARQRKMPDGDPDSVVFLVVKNSLFWGSMALSMAAIYAAVSLFL